ncbi:hypothetical protein ACPPVV_11635 [Rhodanobacter sp. Col0626]|uniref:hypothetical protein n=1 Tax=Rhodanobacter sp. Col0626 TaxID=3415679 RepID=UPI003CEA11DE
MRYGALDLTAIDPEVLQHPDDYFRVTIAVKEIAPLSTPERVAQLNAAAQQIIAEMQLTPNVASPNTIKRPTSNGVGSNKDRCSFSVIAV